MRLDALDDAARAAGLRPADNVLFTQMDTPARVSGVYHYTPTQAGRGGEMVRVPVQRGSRRLTISYALRHTDPVTTFIAQLGFKLILLLIAMLLLWRGTDRASLILGLWCLTVGIGLPDAWWGGLPLFGRMAGGALTAALWTVSPFLLYLVVEAIATGVSRTTVIIARCAMIITMLPALIVNTVNATAQAVSGCSLVPVTTWLANAAFVSSQLVIVAFFAVSYLRTTGLAKQRVRWVFWAFLISRAGVLLNLINRLAIHPLHLSGLEWITVVIFPLGCTYAILRHRIIDVNFVLNRTLIYTILTTFVVGIFVLLEYVLHAFAASRGVGIALDVIVALILGLSFNVLYKRVEIGIERALFRSKHQAAIAMQQLSEEAAYMENAESLLERAVLEIPQAVQAAGAAIYERVDDGYLLTASNGRDRFPSRVDVDDLALVRLRKLRTQVDLSEMKSALGSDGLAFAFAIRGQLVGALVCRRRTNGEAYAPDEIALLRSVAHEVGAEVTAIRTRRQSELLEQLMAGTIDLRDARARMQQLPATAIPTSLTE